MSKLAKTFAKAARPPSPRPRPGLDSQGQVVATRQLQRELRKRGYYKGKIDGIAGPLTRRAFEQFQQASGMDVTGRNDQRSVTALTGGGGRATPAPPVSKPGSDFVSASREFDPGEAPWWTETEEYRSPIGMGSDPNEFGSELRGLAAKLPTPPGGSGNLYKTLGLRTPLLDQVPKGAPRAPAPPEEPLDIAGAVLGPINDAYGLGLDQPTAGGYSPVVAGRPDVPVGAFPAASGEQAILNALHRALSEAPPGPLNRVSRR